jgi:phospholipid/cholesterol/gamma-HCH transport system ATP-binding protein
MTRAAGDTKPVVSALTPALRPIGDEPILSLRDVTVGYRDKIVQQQLSFDVRRGSVFAIMGASGAGKSTVLSTLIGLTEPQGGKMTFAGENYWALPVSERERIGRRFGVLFQSGALWSSLTVGENVALPMQLFTNLDRRTMRRLVELKLALVGLEDAFDLMPAELSGGMAKRAGLARALALDPEVLFLDEPSAGLDPVAARRLDDLILDLRDALGATIVVVSHDLLSLFAIADDGVFLDAKTRSVIAHGSAAQLRDQSEDPRVQAFMRREDLGSSGPHPSPYLEDKLWQVHGSRR